MTVVIDALVNYRTDIFVKLKRAQVKANRLVVQIVVHRCADTPLYHYMKIYIQLDTVETCNVVACCSDANLVEI